MNTTSIEWMSGGKSWNPITGCTPCSLGCQKCYAKRMANRLRGRAGYPADDPFRVTFHKDKLDQVNPKQKPTRIFVCSMGDLLHRDVPNDWINQVLNAIEGCPQHRFFVLTKRIKRADEQCWPRNVALGVSVCVQDEAWKIGVLGGINAAMRFVSFEPLLADPWPLNLDGISWCIAGGESGPGARPSHPDWFRRVRDDCKAAGVPFFFKQWGEWAPEDAIEAVGLAKYGWWEDDGAEQHEWPGPVLSGRELCSLRPCVYRVGKKAAGRLLDGVEHTEFPEGWGPR